MPVNVACHSMGANKRKMSERKHPQTVLMKISVGAWTLQKPHHAPLVAKLKVLLQ